MMTGVDDAVTSAEICPGSMLARARMMALPSRRRLRVRRSLVGVEPLDDREPSDGERDDSQKDESEPEKILVEHAYIVSSVLALINTESRFDPESYIRRGHAVRDRDERIGEGCYRSRSEDPT